MQVALVHDYLMQDGGAERVLLELHRLFPRAPIYTLFYDPKRVHPDFRQANIITSKLNRYPLANSKSYEWYLPLMAQNVEAFDLSSYDLVISSSSSFAKGAIAAPNALHICYCHTPTRFLWQERHSYLKERSHSRLMKRLLHHYLHRLRQWDTLAAQRPDIMLTNSKISQSRIKRFYQRDSTIIYPPVDISSIHVNHSLGRYWLAGGRLVAYKRFDLVVRAFTNLNLPLFIFGEGPEEAKLRRIAGPTIEFLGHVTDAKKNELYQGCLGYLYPQIEDFGISAVEAMAAGKPVIAFGQGGATETVLNGVSGQLFDVQCWEDIGNAIIRFDASRYDPDRIRAHAETFSQERFRERITNALKQLNLAL